MSQNPKVAPCGAGGSVQSLTWSSWHCRTFSDTSPSSSFQLTHMRGGCMLCRSQASRRRWQNRRRKHAKSSACSRGTGGGKGLACKVAASLQKRCFLPALHCCFVVGFWGNTAQRNSYLVRALAEGIGDCSMKQLVSEGERDSSILLKVIPLM